ncbi:Putative transciprtional termination factor [Mesomycoplasma conjunctivae]|uniref:YlxR domain-containing protein n=1 Tax=Mesomycoplasma conjunctivae (strain ATCC 25834 / NCTC 10147 / HRC/581) TaxID=572263 RepID=C5J6Y0_MESCH|nr:YlxR family protein [Mesomycoplasma conjunctivae]CAT05243.1 HYPOTHETICAL PROTEIN MCJ_005440 [Mesomycoplasma conjunctivae]VEU66464.1 Putative transciprtional termination factor [Mesomycoplasma conjunctivae]
MFKNYHRKCIVCQTSRPVEQLLRFSRQEENIFLDLMENEKIAGRGAYVCKRDDEIAIIFKKKMLNRAFRHKFENKVYENIENEVKTKWLKMKNENQM